MAKLASYQRYEVVRRNPDGTYDEVGMNNRYTTKHYSSLSTLHLYGVPEPFKKAGFIVKDARGKVLAEYPPMN